MQLCRGNGTYRFTLCEKERFTWFSGNGLATIKLDRFMLYDNLVFDWKLEVGEGGSLKLTKACKFSFITLILKILNPQLLMKYKPICLFCSLLKILFKLLAAKLKGVIRKLVSIK